ncbi:MAG: hypothetical protein ACYDHH_12485 [Solirubrobacteraceae bacterium]
MSKKLELKLLYAAAWCGPVWLVGYVVSFGILGHNDPPPSIGGTPQQLLNSYFVPYHTQIMIGMLICMVIGVFYLPFSAAMAKVMLRREHHMPLLSTLCICGGAITAWIVAEFPGKILSAAWYGNSHAPVVADIWRSAWFVYDNTYMCTGFQMIAVAIYALTDRSAKPVFPKWTAWLAIFGVLSFVPEAAIPYAHNGPFAVQGLWNFWIAFAAWLIWFGAFAFYTIRYVRGQLRAYVEPTEQPELVPDAQLEVLHS